MYLSGAPTWILIEDHGKLERKADEGRWVGFSVESKGHQIHWLGKRCVSVERNVKFDESVIITVDNAHVEGGDETMNNTCTINIPPDVKISADANLPTDVSSTPQDPNMNAPATPYTSQGTRKNALKGFEDQLTLEKNYQDEVTGHENLLLTGSPKAVGRCISDHGVAATLTCNSTAFQLEYFVSHSP
jgi:hypothetical protein